LELQPGKRYEYRYLLNDGRWVNDHSADHYVHISGLHVDNCVITVTEEVKEAKKAAVKTPTEQVTPVVEKAKAPAKKVAAAKEKTATVNTAAPKAKSAKTKSTDSKA
jgi:hypothetical protein